MQLRFVALALAGAITLAGCQDQPTSPTEQSLSLAKDKTTALSGSPTERIAQIAARVNARLEAAGSTKRLDEVWLFTVGQGTDPFRRLRTGPRWHNPENVTYMIDTDYTTDGGLTGAQVRAAVVQSFERHDAVENITLNLTEVPFPGGNLDILDGRIDNANGQCVDVVDLDSDILNSYDPATGALDFDIIVDNFFGGWYPASYFVDCLGSANIIGVTWTFSDEDGAFNGVKDGYRDRIYTEQYYNDGFFWVDGGSPFLSSIMDIQSIVTHEVGHAMGLGHFGGPNTNQPFKLQPNGRVFDPEAVMNPFYIGGDKRELLPTDIAGLRALYGNKAGKDR